MFKINSFKSKLDINGLYIKSPVNAKAILSQNERDMFDTLIHLQNLKKTHISDSLIMANSGLNTNQITKSKKNLMTLGLISIKHYSTKGSIYILNINMYNEMINSLNKITKSCDRFTKGDEIRKENGLNPIFSNIINTLNRKFSEQSTLTDEEKIYTLSQSDKKKSAKEWTLSDIEKAYSEGKIDRHTYSSFINKLKNKNYENK